MKFELICYLNFGYPTIQDGIRAACTYIECGCTALQIDIPSRNPYLEHQTIQDRMKYCLEHTPDYTSYFDGIAEIRRRYPDLRLVFMLYEDTVEELGVERILAFCEENQIYMATYVGSNETIKNSLIAGGLEIACYVRFHLPKNEVDFAVASTMPTLLQMRPTEPVREGYETYSACLDYLRQAGISGNIYASVGVKTPDDIRTAKIAGANGAFVGSILMNVIDDEVALRTLISQLMLAVNEEESDIA